MTNLIPSLPPDIIMLIAVRVLVYDPIDLVSFRAACHLFRSYSPSPNPGSLASLYRPRHWIMLSDDCCDLKIPRCFLNLSSCRSLKISLPELYGHAILTSADGLLVLLHEETSIVRLLNPFTRLLVDLPPLMPSSKYFFRSRRHNHIHQSLSPPLVSAAISFSDVHNPTVMISFEKANTVIVSKPGDRRWVPVKHLNIFQYNIIFFQGRFCATNKQGTVCTIHLEQEKELEHHQKEQQQDKITEIVSPNWGEPDRNNSVYRSYMVESNSTLLLVRKYFSPIANNTLVEVYQVNLENNTLDLVNNIGDHTLFVGPTRTLSVSSKNFPCTVPNSIYFVTDLLDGPAVIYRLEDHSCQPISNNTVINLYMNMVESKELSLLRGPIISSLIARIFHDRVRGRCIMSSANFLEDGK